MKLILNEEQIDMIKEYEKKSLYVAKFEVVIDAMSDKDAISQVDAIEKLIKAATDDDEWYSSLETRVRFGEKPRKLK